MYPKAKVIGRKDDVFILWLGCLGRLNTKDRSAKFGITTDGLCSFCAGMVSAKITSSLCAQSLELSGIKCRNGLESDMFRYNGKKSCLKVEK